MNVTVKKAALSTKKFVRRNKNAIVVASITIPVILVQNAGIKSVNNFLKEKGLYDEYYLIDLFEE